MPWNSVKESEVCDLTQFQSAGQGCKQKTSRMPRWLRVPPSLSGHIYAHYLTLSVRHMLQVSTGPHYTAPLPYDDALADTLVGASRL